MFPWQTFELKLRRGGSLANGEEEERCKQSLYQCSAVCSPTVPSRMALRLWPSTNESPNGRCKQVWPSISKTQNLIVRIDRSSRAVVEAPEGVCGPPEGGTLGWHALREPDGGRQRGTLNPCRSLGTRTRARLRRIASRLLRDNLQVKTYCSLHTHGGRRRAFPAIPSPPRLTPTSVNPSSSA
eukprot:COSAG04_NODE_6875_length_1236_cov_10.103782_2_plen_183_part_00